MPVILTSDRQSLPPRVTGELVAMRDLEALTRDPGITVNDGVG